MSAVINSVLKAVSRNLDGFEDVDNFWSTSEKLTLPLKEQIRVSLISSTKPVATPSKSTPQKADSDIEFNYDTSPDISDDEEDDDDEEESISDNDKDDHDDFPSPGEVSTKTGKSQSILTSGVKSNRNSIQSSVYSPLNASLATVGVSPLGTTNGSIRQSLESGVDGSDVSGRESILSRATPSTAGGSTRNSINPDSSRSIANTTNNTTINTSPSTSRNTSVNASSNNSSRHSDPDTSIDNSANTSANTSAASRRASESGLDITSGRSPDESSFFADRSEDMNETGVRSEFGFGQKPPTSASKSRRASSQADSLATPGSAAKPAAPALASATKGARSGGDRSNRRVSFGRDDLADLSPIEASGLGSADTGASKRTQSRNSSRNSSHRASLESSLELSPAESIAASAISSKDTSRNTTKNTTINSSRNTTINTTHNTTASSVRSEHSAGASSLQQDQDQDQDQDQEDNDDGSFGNDFANDYDEPEEFDRDEEQELEQGDDEPSRLASQTDTPTTNRSFSHSGMGEELRSPYSEASSSRTPASSNRRRGGGGGSMSMISTPGSNEFVRGYHLPDPDASVMNELSTDEEGEDLDETGVSTPEVGRKKGKLGKKHTVTDGEEDDDLNTTNPNEVTLSFIDREYLHTIGSSNKKYVKAREELRKSKPRVSKPRRTQLYNSSDEEEEEQKGSGEEDDSEAEGEDGGRRRSKRATKGKRFQFWKGERPIYAKGTLVEIAKPEPTPQKRKRVTAKVTEDGKAAKRAKKASRATGSDDEEEEEEGHAAAHQLPPVRLPHNVKYLRRDDIDTLEIWDEVLETQGEEKVFCTAESLLPAVALPRTAKRQPGRDKVGYAAHSFNVPEVPNVMSGWLSGFIDLPPEAIKDAEGVGRFTQVFFVSDCQDGALELGLANPSQDEWVDRSAQRVLLKKGDCFYVPPGNIYRLENHSAVKSSKLNWVIIKPLELPLEDGEGEGEEGSVVSAGSLGDSPNTTGALLDGKPGRRAPISVEEDM